MAYDRDWERRIRRGTEKLPKCRMPFCHSTDTKVIGFRNGSQYALCVECVADILNPDCVVYRNYPSMTPKQVEHEFGAFWMWRELERKHPALLRGGVA